MSLMRAETATDPASTATGELPAARDMAYERCESCGHRAYVMVMTADGPLAFCAHHYQENALALAGVGVVIHDIRDQLTPTNRPTD